MQEIKDITFAAHHDKDENKQAYLGRARGKHTFFDYQQKATRGYVVELKPLSRTTEDFHQHWRGCTSLFPYCHTNSIVKKCIMAVSKLSHARDLTT